MDISAIFTQAFSIIFQQKIVIYIFIFCVSVILLKFFFKLGKRIFSRGAVFKYRQIGFLFTKSEYVFFLVLQQAISDQYDIFGKVRIADVLSPVEDLDRKRWWSAFNSISFKHFDYVLCDKDSSTIVAAIELDDKSHSRPKTKERDIFVENACKSANFRLLRFRCASNYCVEDIRRTVLNGLNN